MRMSETQTTAPPVTRDTKKDRVRGQLVDALIALLAEGSDINHDRVAERAGVGRRADADLLAPNA